MPAASTRPVQKLAAAVAKCGPQAATYGQCIAVDYNNVHKGLCEKEFLQFKECVMGSLKKK